MPTIILTSEGSEKSEILNVKYNMILLTTEKVYRIYR